VTEVPVTDHKLPIRTRAASVASRTAAALFQATGGDRSVISGRIGLLIDPDLWPTPSRRPWLSSCGTVNPDTNERRKSSIQT
jgi:hypothetical protein